MPHDERFLLDSVPEEYRVAYAWYLSDNATFSDRTMSPDEFVAYRKELEAEGRKF